MECQQHPDNSLPATTTSLIIQEGKNTNELLQKKGGLLFAHLLLMRALAWLYSDGMMMKNTNSFAFKSFPFSPTSFLLINSSLHIEKWSLSYSRQTLEICA